MGGGVSGVGGSGNILEQPPKQRETDLNQIDAINAFNNLIQELSSIASEAKLGEKRDG